MHHNSAQMHKLICFHIYDAWVYHKFINLKIVQAESINLYIIAPTTSY